MNRLDLQQEFENFIKEFWSDHAAFTEEDQQEFLLQLFYDKFLYTFNIPPPFNIEIVLGSWDLFDYHIGMEIEKEQLVKMGVPSEYL